MGWGDDYLEQYIFPPLIHNSLERQTIPPQGLVLAYNGVHLSHLYNISPFDYAEEVAQRYEVAANDSVRIMGVALYSYFNPIHNPAREVDYITVSILNSDLTETLYSQTFASGSAGDPNFDFISYINTPGGHNGFFILLLNVFLMIQLLCMEIILLPLSIMACALLGFIIQMFIVLIWRICI